MRPKWKLPIMTKQRRDKAGTANSRRRRCPDARMTPGAFPNLAQLTIGARLRQESAMRIHDASSGTLRVKDAGHQRQD